MTLGELIETLEREPADKVVPVGFTHAHSYRGYYDELAFEFAANVRVGDMLNEALSAVEKVFGGYKGGDYRMSLATDCWLAEYGRCGEAFSKLTLAVMLGHGPEALAALVCNAAD